MKSKYTKVFTKHTEEILFDAYARWANEGKKFKKTILWLDIFDENNNHIESNYHGTNQYMSWSNAKRILNEWADKFIADLEIKKEIQNV